MAIQDFILRTESAISFDTNAVNLRIFVIMRAHCAALRSGMAAKNGGSAMDRAFIKFSVFFRLTTLNRSVAHLLLKGTKRANQTLLVCSTRSHLCMDDKKDIFTLFLFKLELSRIILVIYLAMLTVILYSPCNF